MWLDNLKELKKSKGMTSKQIADATKIPEGTIKRIFAGGTTGIGKNLLYRSPQHHQIVFHKKPLFIQAVPRTAFF